MNLIEQPVLPLPPILDACCGGRMFWWDKTNPDALFMDCREVEKGAFQNGWNPNWCVSPDVVADFRKMPFPDGSFRMAVFDPPHLTSGSMKSVINKKYGLLNRDTWKQDIVDGFKECWRVLAPNGVLIFKWNEANIKAKELLRAFPVEPLFGDFTGKTGGTIWVTFFEVGRQESTIRPLTSMGRNATNLQGERYGKLVVLSMVSRNQHGNSRWLCQCDCGSTTEVYYQNLKSKYVRSCGCLPKGRPPKKAC